MVEDIVSARLHEITEHYDESIGVLIAKVLFHQEQVRCAAHALDSFASEIDNRSYNTRELLSRITETLSAIFNDLIPVDEHADYAHLTKDLIQEHLSKHCGDYNGELDLSNPYEDGVAEEIAIDFAAGVDESVINEVNRGRRARGARPIPEEVDDDDIMSAVSDEVQEEFTTRRRRRR